MTNAYREAGAREPDVALDRRPGRHVAYGARGKARCPYCGLVDSLSHPEPSLLDSYAPDRLLTDQISNGYYCTGPWYAFWRRCPKKAGLHLHQQCGRCRLSWAVVVIVSETRRKSLRPCT